MWESVSLTHASTSLPSTTPPDWLPARLPQHWAPSLEIDCVTAIELENGASRQEGRKAGERERLRITVGKVDQCVCVCEHNTAERSSKSAVNVYPLWPWLDVYTDKHAHVHSFTHMPPSLGPRGLRSLSRACTHLDRCYMSEGKDFPWRLLKCWTNIYSSQDWQL